jgi:hypothetical protein
MVDRWPESPERVPPHPLWQSPFVFATADEPWERIQARVRRAGELWLTNHDFRPYEELIIAHAEQPWFMGFHRVIRPDQVHIVIGPLNRRVLNPSDGTSLFGLPLVYRENEQASARELWERLPRRR